VYDNTVIYDDAATFVIDQISPVYGANGGGTTVTITGSGFSPPDG